MLEEISHAVEKRPILIFAAVAVVALLAYLQSRNNQPQVISAEFAGGGTARGIDPNAAAIEQAAIGAGQANVQTLASLIGTENTNQASLYGSLAQTSAARDTSLAQTEAGRTVGLSQISAALRASLADTSARMETTDAQTAAGVTINRDNSAASLQAASISAQYAQEVARINAATEAARITAAQDVANFQTQASKDIARAADNTSLVNNFVGGVKDVLAFFGI